MRVVSILWATEIPRLQVYLFRRQSVDLEKNHLDGPTGYRALLAPWIKMGYADIVKGEIRFGNGSKIFLCHCKDEEDKENYRGAEFHVLLMDEITHFTETQYRFLRSRCRIPESLQIPDKYKGLFPRILLSGNPGGVGHLWVKRLFIDNALPLELRYTSDEEGGFRRQFIPAKLEDNPSLNKSEYERSLAGLGSPALVRAMRDGDWNVVAGAYFPEFGEPHIIEPLPIPASWQRFRAFDWGSASPFCVLWIACSDGTHGPPNWDPHWIPQNALVVYREWYGGTPEDTGIHLRNEDIAHGIQSREGLNERIVYSVADPSIFKEDGGPSIGEQFAREGVFFMKGDNTRLAGWQQIRSRLIGMKDTPMLYFFRTAKNLIRTLPALQHDEKKPEDIDTESADHCADALRYGCMSRPWARPGEKKPPLRTIKEMTLNELWEHRDAYQSRGRRY